SARARQPQQAGRVVRQFRARARRRSVGRSGRSGGEIRRPVLQIREDLTAMTSILGISTPTGPDARKSDYQELKARIHQELLSRLNLEKLTLVAREDAEPEIRGLIAEMIAAETQTTPLSLSERETLVGDVLNELFGLGPLELLLQDPDISDILVNRFD